MPVQDEIIFLIGNTYIFNMLIYIGILNCEVNMGDNKVFISWDSMPGCLPYYYTHMGTHIDHIEVPIGSIVIYRVWYEYVSIQWVYTLRTGELYTQ